MPFFAPDIDFILEKLKSSPPYLSKKANSKLKEIYNLMSNIKPLPDSDGVRRLWINASRGSIKNFGNFKEYKREGIVETHEQFTDYWSEQYPDQTKWYGFSTAKYQKELYFYIDGELIIKESGNDRKPAQINVSEKDIEKFLLWLTENVASEIRLIKKNPGAYNQNIQKNLPYHKLFGKIKRKEFWNIAEDETLRLDRMVDAEEVKILEEIVKSQSEGKNIFLTNVTANDFFRYCEICYEANKYFKKSKRKLSPKEKYLQMADGRDAGFREINGNSEKEFLKWYQSGITGAHPWEICRGGNTTHISLYVTRDQGKWKLQLDGSSVVRVVETVKMAVALKKHGIPFYFVKGREILDMVTGNDYIGIVPDYIYPRYAHQYFPTVDRIVDFMHLGREKAEEIIEKASWYPIERVEITG